MAEAAAIEAAFARLDLAAIRAALADQAGKGSEFAARALAAMATEVADEPGDRAAADGGRRAI